MATRSSKLGGSAAAVIEYLTDGERTFDYYAEGSELDGFKDVWGNLGLELGLSQGISQSQWSELFAGQWAGQKVVGTGYRRHVDKTTGDVTIETGVRTPMIDVVFAVPKGVSELYARAATDDQAKAIGAAVFEAAKVAWTEGVEGHARAARVATKRTSDGKTHYDRVLAKLACTPVLQFTARPTAETLAAGAPADPHLHVHCATFTASKVGEKWYTIDEAAIRRTAEYRDQLFMGELARRLERLGYELDYDDFDTARNGRISFEPKISSFELRQHWSKNHRRAVALSRSFLDLHGRPPTDWELNALMRDTRSKKSDKEMDARPVRSRWLSDAQRHGLVADVVYPGRVKMTTPQKRFELLTRRLNGPNGLTREDAAFPSSSVGPAIAAAAVGLHLTRNELKTFEASYRRGLVCLRPAIDPDHELLTTRTMLSVEEFVTSDRRNRAKMRFLPVPHSIVKRVIEEQPFKLEAEQRQGVIAATSTSGWVHIEGYAGSGKTTLLAAVRDAHRRAGTVDDIVVVSTAGATAERTARSLDLDHYGPIESIVARLQSGQLAATERTLWFIDEAAMVDTHRMAKLLGAIGPGRVVLVGDEAQLSAIGAAGWYAESIAEHSSVMLTQVHRHRDEADTRAFRMVRELDAQSAVTDLVARRRVHVDDDKMSRVARVMGDYSNMRDAGYSAGDIRQIIETSNHDVDLYNALVQRDRHQRGELGSEWVEVHDNQQDRTWRLHRGDQVLFLANYESRRGHKVRNGTTGVVVYVDPASGVVQVACHQQIVDVSSDPRRSRQPLGLAYAQHANKIQGGEVQMVQVLPGTARTATANSAYSQLTRARHEAHVYLDVETHGDDPVATVIESWSVAEDRRTASSFLPGYEVPTKTQAPPTGPGLAEPCPASPLSPDLHERASDEGPLLEDTWNEPDITWDAPAEDEVAWEPTDWARGGDEGISY